MPDDLLARPDTALRQPDLIDGQDADGLIHLQAARCRTCGTHSVPPRRRCPSCYGGDLEQVRLPRSGTVVSATVVRRAAAGYAGPLPFVLARVRIGPDVHVLARLTGRPVDDWRPGDAVVVASLSLPRAGGGEAAAFAFRPATDGRG